MTSTTRPGAAERAQPGDAAAAARGHRRLPGRARLERHVHHAGLAAGGREPGRAAAPLPDEERPGPRRDRPPLHRPRRTRCVARVAALPDGPTRTRAVLEMLAEQFTGPLFVAALELWVAARTDAALREAVAGWRPGSVGTRTGTPSRRSASTSRSRAAASWCRRPSTSSAASAWPTRSPTTPYAAAASSTGGPRSSTPTWPAPATPTSSPRRTTVTDHRLRAVLDDLAVEGDWLDAPRRRPSTSPAGARPTPAEGWDVATSIAHLAWTDEVAVLAATDKAGWDAVVLDGHRRPARVRATPRRSPAAPYLPPSCWPRWRTARSRLAGALERTRPGDEAAVVRPADEPDLDGDRPLHGDLGARARRRRRARRGRRAARPGRATSSTSGCGPGASPSPTTGWPRRPRRCASS